MTHVSCPAKRGSSYPKKAQLRRRKQSHPASSANNPHTKRGSLVSKRVSRRQGFPALARESSAKVGTSVGRNRPRMQRRNLRKFSTARLMITFFRSRRSYDHFL